MQESNMLVPCEANNKTGFMAKDKANTRKGEKRNILVEALLSLCTSITYLNVLVKCAILVTSVYQWTNTSVVHLLDVSNI